LIQRRFDRCDLNQNFVRAAVIDDHLPDATHVPLDAREAIGETFLRLRRQYSAVCDLSSEMPIHPPHDTTQHDAAVVLVASTRSMRTRSPRQQAPFGFFTSHAQCPTWTPRATIPRSSRDRAASLIAPAVNRFLNRPQPPSAARTSRRPSKGASAMPALVRTSPGQVQR
jgi:hypothetical protein